MTTLVQSREAVGHFMHGLERRNPGEPEFHQAYGVV